MTVRLRPNEDPRPATEDWPLPKEPLFLRSEAFETLARDLGRYVGGDVNGRSYLVAGHRGAGKTSLVNRAVQETYREFLEGSLKRQPSTAGVGVPPQRPLLVRLYGPSLVEPLAPTRAEQEDKRLALELQTASAKAAHAIATLKDGAPPAAESAADAKPDAHPDPKPDDAKAPATPSPPPANGQAAKTQAVLVQITIALYRALAQEMAASYARHARAFVGAGAEGEAFESAAQLALDLDTATAPAQLRAYWNRLSRLERGVLWPPAVDRILGQDKIPDQGVREIVALATAGQVFEVCSGVVSQSQSSKQTLTSEQELKGSGTTDLGQVLTRLAPLGLAGLTGATVLGSSGGKETVAALAGGALVWLLGSASLSWSFSRKRTGDQSADYVFIRDRTIQTLDRDLPLVMRRVREAGLAPVFVVDELDKLDDPDNTIGEIIKQLKHIVADNGFFCFLADRDYFDFIEDTVRKTAFPKEHTYFSERRLIAYSPTEIRAHVLDQLVLTGAPEPELVAADAFALWVAHRAKLNFTAVMRELRSLSGSPTDAGNVTDELIRRATLLDVQLAATVQIAINEVLSSDEMASRIASDSGFAQLAHDALYFLSRQWEAGEEVFDVSRTALEKELKARLAKPGDQEPRFDKADLDMLERATRMLVRLLRNLPALRARLEIDILTDRKRLAAIIPSQRAPRLLQPDPEGKKDHFRFCFDSFGRDLQTHAGRADPGEIDELIAIFDQFQALLNAMVIEVTDLSDAGLIESARLDWPTLIGARMRMQPAPPGMPPLPNPTYATDLEALRALRQQLDQHGRRLGAGLSLAQRLGFQAGIPLKFALQVMAAYPVMPAPPQAQTWTLADWAATHPAPFPRLDGRDTLAGDPTQIEDWVHDAMMVPPEPPAPAPSDAALWELWRPRLERWFASPTPATDFGWPELVAAAQIRPPHAFLKADLARATLMDLSLLALSALPRPGGPPPWAIVAAMRLLGFGADLLHRIALGVTEADTSSPDGPSVASPSEAAVKFATGAEERRRGGLLLIYDFPAHPSLLEIPRRRPVLLVARSELTVHQLGLEWLHSLRAFDGVLDQNG